MIVKKVWTALLILVLMIWPFIQSWRAEMIRIFLKGVLKYRIFVLFPLIMSVFSLNILAQGENTKESAAAVIKKVFMESGSEAAKMKFKEMHIGEEGKYYFNEQEFIKLGNSLRSSGRVKAAITAFKMTIELFPESSNAWFRLGQAFVRDVNREKAVECYKKALELDSKNAMAKEEMGWIDFRIDDARLETREIERFEPGVKTGLQGPYLGETPPGMKPKVFAPGIVSVYGSNENTITFSPDGKYFFYTSHKDIYWISAEYLKKFKPKKTVTNPLRYHHSKIFPLISSGPCQNSD